MIKLHKTWLDAKILGFITDFYNQTFSSHVDSQDYCARRLKLFAEELQGKFNQKAKDEGLFD